MDDDFKFNPEDLPDEDDDMEYFDDHIGEDDDGDIG